MAITDPSRQRSPQSKFKIRSVNIRLINHINLIKFGVFIPLIKTGPFI